ncbi:MAG: tRNA threonylcarbamoyladenosine dehydratase [Lachnospiraceae bacterium]|nr:tRNA threonylcarbamoyladenosine dehydratase [Lachnospiraceae bacterium]
MQEQFIRTAMLIGEDGVEKLLSSRVCVFGVGGVGGFTVEALARSGVGAIDLVDADLVSLSNINRQIIADHKTVGRPKVEVAKERISAINPDCKVTIHNMFFLPENADEIDMNAYDYVVDAVDTVTAKIEIIKRAKEAGVPVISCMGAANKLDPTAFKVADIYKTSVCPLARVMRRELKKRGIDSLKVVYSQEEAMKPIDVLSEETTGDVARYQKETTENAAGSSEVITGNKTESQEHVKRVTPASIAFVPSVAGMIAAGEVIKDLTKSGSSSD